MVTEQPIDKARNTDKDEAAMAEVGKVQKLQRNFGFWTILGLTASMMCTWEAVFFVSPAIRSLIKLCTDPKTKW